MLGRRVIILVAIVMGLTALAASVAPPPPRTTVTPGGAPPDVQAPRADVRPLDVRRTLRIGATARPRIELELGQNLTLDVAGDVIDTVAIPELGVLEPVEPGSPAGIQVYADTPGMYPIRLLDANRSIGVIEIRRPS
jgi:heme/copper-type cytochrome/quinol oxidase subunit 2